MTRAEIKQRENMPKLKIRKGDKVKIIAGKDKGESGYVWRVIPKKMRVIVLKDNPESPDNPLPINAATKHRKARTQGEKSARILIPMPIHISNVMVLDPSSGEPTRVGRRKEGGKIVRYAKKSGTSFLDEPLIAKD